MGMFEAEIKEILDSKKDELTADVMKGLKERITNSIVWKAEDVLQKEVTEFVTNHIMPEVRKELLENKEALTGLFLSTAKDIAVDISLSITKKIGESLKDSWKVKKLLESLL